MKTKIIRREGVQSLVVDDDEINNTSKYGSPILLAVITNYFNSSCWSFEDYRLKNNLIPSAYLNDNHENIYNFKDYNEEDKNIVLSKLHTYDLNDEGLFYWMFDGVDLNGDIPNDDPRRKLTNGQEYPRCACFTFKEAQKKLSDAKKFWETYNGSLTDENIKIHNQHRQPHSAEYYFDLSFNKERLEKAIKNKK